MGTDANVWRVGEVADLMGLSVRTLHYYEEMGLLVPSDRTETGHRRYTEADLARLQQILSLKSIGEALHGGTRLRSPVWHEPRAVGIRGKSDGVMKNRSVAAVATANGNTSAHDMPGHFIRHIIGDMVEKRTTEKVVPFLSAFIRLRVRCEADGEFRSGESASSLDLPRLHTPSSSAELCNSRGQNGSARCPRSPSTPR